jgi:signal transduction histidine kinase
MTLKNFLVRNRDLILEMSWEKTKTLAALRDASDLLKSGLPLFYDELIDVLEQKTNAKAHENILLTAAEHGRELLRLGYTLSHVVHAYGAMCQAITECATTKNANITPGEFNILNGCLDIAIASAVSEFQFKSNEASEAREIQHLGFLAHELRNALSSATVAHDMIKVGLVGTGGSTASVLSMNLSRMRHLIDRSLSEVRLRSDAEVFIEKFRLCDLLDQLTVTSKIDAEKKKQTLKYVADSRIELETDRQFLLSAIANLIQNAIKYTRVGGNIWLRGTAADGRVFIEIEDECGGIDEEKLETLFQPYVQAHDDRSGLGLGLAIVQRAVELSQGTIVAINKPGVGCIFKIDIPQKLVANTKSGKAVSGMDAVQPDYSKKS